MLTRQEKIALIDAEIERLTEEHIEVSPRKNAISHVGMCMDTELELWLGILYYYKGLLEKDPQWVQMSDSLFRSHESRLDDFSLEQVVTGSDTQRINQNTLLAAIFRSLVDLCHHFRVAKKEPDNVEIEEIFCTEE